MLPPISNSGNLNGMMVNKNGNALPPTYQYIMKPSKIKNIAKPLLSNGVNGEKISLNPAVHYKANMHSNSVNAALNNNLNALNIDKNSLILPPTNNHYSLSNGGSIHNLDLNINGSTELKKPAQRKKKNISPAN